MGGEDASMPACAKKRRFRQRRRNSTSSLSHDDPGNDRARPSAEASTLQDLLAKLELAQSPGIAVTLTMPSVPRRE